METIDESADLHAAKFVDTDLRGARFVRSDLSGAVMRGVDVDGADIDAPWLLDGETSLRVNGVDVVPFVEAELNRRFPAAPTRRAGDPDGLRAAWATLEGTWAATLERVAAMPAGTVDISVDGEWSFAQTLRHLVLGHGHVAGSGNPGDRAAVPPPRSADAGAEDGRPGHVGLHDGHAVVRRSARGPGRPGRHGARLPRRRHRRGTGRRRARTRGPRNTRRPPCSCLHVILEEEWEHHRYAVRDLDAIDSGLDDGVHDHPDDDIDPRLEALRASSGRRRLTAAPIRARLRRRSGDLAVVLTRTTASHTSRPAIDPKEPTTPWVYPSDASRMPARASDARTSRSSLPTLEECTHCHEMKLPHHVCPNCGYYNGRLAIELKPAAGRRRRALTR